MGNLTDSLEDAVRTGLLPRGGRVLVACSGGADSVALAGVMAGCSKARCAIGHVDHGLRPESGREAEQVRVLAGRLGVPFFLERIQALELKSTGLEAAAREARYGALARLARQADAPVVATAHTRRDQAETLLLRLARGAGPGALAGIRRSRELAPGIRVVRPWLGVSRSETEVYCRENGLPFTDDPHNSDPARARARLRAAWPALLDLNPRLEEALAGAADIFADEDDLLSGMSATVTPRLDTLRLLHPALLRRALLAMAVRAGVRPERGHLEELRALVAKSGGAVDLPGGRAVVRKGELRFEQRASGQRQPHSAAEVAVPGPGSYSWQSRELEVSLGAGERTVDLARAPFPWTLRGHRPGDRFRPAGGRIKKVADLWIDAHIPREERTSLALLVDARGQLFWVEGLREGAPLRGNKSAPASFEIR